MGIIKILDESVSNIISAGEVVENPSSLIKELLENSLDAKSKNIKIEVKNGGRYVNISDNGKGMIKEDLLVSIERHATSKIREKEDLFNLTSYGFRGEALSSICAVSKVKIMSKTNEDKMGTSISVLAGKITSLKENDKNTGTEIEINELFFNTPARMKFLRKPTTEYLNIKEVVLQEALVNYNVGINLIIEGRETVNTTGNGIENTIVELFGKNILKNLIKFDYGYIGNSSISRSTRDSIFVFVNGRMVKSKIIETALIDSYYTKLVKGKYPFAIVFLNLDPKDVDVNVHPSKKIVKFSNDTHVYEMIRTAVSKEINGTDDLTSRDVEVKTENKILKKPMFTENKNFNISEYINSKTLGIGKEPEKEVKKDDFEIDMETGEIIKTGSNSIGDKTNNVESTNNKNNINSAEIVKPPSEVNEMKNKYTENINEINNESEKNNKIIRKENYINKNYKIIGQFYNSYILVENNGVLEIYDQHIVHERVLYEELKKDILSKDISRQALLIPQRINVDVRDKDIIFEKKEILKELGFEIEEFGKNEILIRTIPIFKFQETIESLFREVIKELKEYKQRDPRESIIISMSCKGAIKAGQKLTMEEMDILIGDLHKIGEYTCPHGRPIILKLDLNEIEKKFKRK
ncbi:MAG: DNA mismatch repair endonuclease MutL [Fusobacteriaceae bacterium]